MTRLSYLFWVQTATYLKQVRMTHSINTPEMAALLSWLKSAREKQALTMRDLSTRLDKPHSYVQKVEQGERRLDVVEFVWYCEALGINPLQGIKLLAAKKGPLCS